MCFLVVVVASVVVVVVVVVAKQSVPTGSKPVKQVHAPVPGSIAPLSVGPEDK